MDLLKIILFCNVLVNLVAVVLATILCLRNRKQEEMLKRFREHNDEVWKMEMEWVRRILIDSVNDSHQEINNKSDN